MFYLSGKDQLCSNTWVSQNQQSKYVHIYLSPWGPVTDFQTVKHRQIEKEGAQCCSLVALNSSKLYPTKPTQTPILLMLQCYIEGKGILMLEDGNLEENGIPAKWKTDFLNVTPRECPLSAICSPELFSPSVSVPVNQGHVTLSIMFTFKKIILKYL